MQTALYYIVLALLCGIFSLVSFTVMLPYPITRIQKFLIFLYTFAIILIQSFTSLRFSLLSVILILSGMLYFILLSREHKIINLLSALLNLCVALGTSYLLMAVASHFFIDIIFFQKYSYMFCLYFIVQIIFTYFASHYLYKALLFFYYKTRNTRIKEQQLTEQLAQAHTIKDYTAKIESLYLDIRTFKHDYINILSTLHGYIAEQNYKGLESYFHNEILPTGTEMALEDSIYGRLGYIQNTEIKSIIYSKIIPAIKEGINVTTNINEKITDFPIGTIDLVRILGILLDNALEACTASAKKFISIIFYKDTKSIFIQISNASPKIDTISLDNNIINRQSMNSISINNIDKLYEKNTTTKGKHRGIGLYEVRQILNQYPNALLSTEYKDYIFTQKLTLLYPLNPD